MSTVAEVVAKGAAFLDEHDPDWWRADVDRAIDLEDLYLGSGRRCILGQRCPMETANAERGSDSPYTANAERLSGLNGRAIADWAPGLGFEADLDSEDIEEQYFALTAEWARVIRERRSAS